MRFAAILISLFLSFVGTSLAEVTYWGLPTKFSLNIVDLTDTTGDAHRLTRPWIVYAKKPFTETRSESRINAEREQHEIRFGDRFYVADQRAGYLHIYKDQENVTDLFASINAVDFGWISSGELLLWNHCAQTKNQVDKKILVVRNDENLQESTDLTTVNWPFRVAPGDDSTIAKAGHSADEFEFYYLFDVSRDGKFFLLGPGPLNKGLGSVFGWLPSSICTPWFNRVALEPNWDQAAKSERSAHHSEIKIFRDESDPAPWAKGGNADEKKVIYKSDPIEVAKVISKTELQDFFKDGRPIGSWLRFPATKMKQVEDVQLITCLVVGEYIKRGKSLESASPVAEPILQDKMGKRVEQINTVNVLFVIDGTKSMGPYLSAIKGALGKAITSLENKSNRDYHFASLVYRDFAEPKLEWTRSMPFDQPIEEFMNFFDDAEFHMNDSDQAEALFYGLSSGMGLWQENQKENTNILIVIGDTGNRPGNQGDAIKVTPESLVRIATPYKPSVIVYQVHNDSSDPSYTNFPRQLKAFVEGLDKSLRAGNTGHSWRTEQGGNVTQQTYQGEILGLVRTPQGSVLNTADLGMKVESDINEIEKSTGMLIELAGRIATSRMPVGTAIKKVEEDHNYEASVNQSPNVYFYEDRALALLGLPKVASSMKEGQRVRFTTQGYTILQRKGDQFPLYKPVLLMGTNEFSSVLSSLNTLYYKVDSREELYNVCKDLLETYVGKLDKDANLDMVLNYVMGELPTRHHELFGNVKLSEIQNENVFSDPDLATWNREFGKLFQKLDAIRSDPNFPRKYKYVGFGSEGSEGIQRDYYWIDEEIIP